PPELSVGASYHCPVGMNLNDRLHCRARSNCLEPASKRRDPCHGSETLRETTRAKGGIATASGESMGLAHPHAGRAPKKYPLRLTQPELALRARWLGTRLRCRASFRRTRRHAAFPRQRARLDSTSTQSLGSGVERDRAASP